MSFVVPRRKALLVCYHTLCTLLSSSPACPTAIATNLLSQFQITGCEVLLPADRASFVFRQLHVLTTVDKVQTLAIWTKYPRFRSLRIAMDSGVAGSAGLCRNAVRTSLRQGIRPSGAILVQEVCFTTIRHIMELTIPIASKLLPALAARYVIVVRSSFEAIRQVRHAPCTVVTVARSSALFLIDRIWVCVVCIVANVVGSAMFVDMNEAPTDIEPSPLDPIWLTFPESFFILPGPFGE